MPPRTIVAAVVLCWLAANGVLVYREALPHWQAGGAPPYNIDLTEELSSSIANWVILSKGRDVGSAASSVHRRRDRTYVLHTELRFRELPLPLIELRKIATSYHVTEDGNLLGLAAEFVIWMKGRGAIDEYRLAIDGNVEEGEFAPRLTLNEQPLPFGAAKVSLEGTGSVVNPMQLLNRVPGLSEGRQWRMALFDPVSALGKAFPEYKEIFAAAEGMTIPELRAVVVADTLRWDDRPVACYKIEYRKPGDPDPIAATWVRRRDGLVLQQFSSSSLMDLTVRRLPNR